MNDAKERAAVERPKYLGGDSEIEGDEKRKACYNAWTVYRDYWESVGESADLTDFRAGFLFGSDVLTTRVRELEAKVARYEKALRHYADDAFWTFAPHAIDADYQTLYRGNAANYFEMDGFEVAREALPPQQPPIDAGGVEEEG